jgi:hypothetical protein
VNRRRDGGRTGRPGRVERELDPTEAPLRHPQRTKEDLEGERSPWKDRTSAHGNGGGTLRTRRRSKALEQVVLPISLRFAIPATGCRIGDGNGTRHGTACLHARPRRVSGRLEAACHAPIGGNSGGKRGSRNISSRRCDGEATDGGLMWGWALGHTGASGRRNRGSAKTILRDGLHHGPVRGFRAATQGSSGSHAMERSRALVPGRPGTPGERSTEANRAPQGVRGAQVLLPSGTWSATQARECGERPTEARKGDRKARNPHATATPVVAGTSLVLR